MEKSIIKESIELLAPAGCWASLQAAMDARADAVYFGLVQLNMRARARRSFRLLDLPEIMARCRQGGVKGYLTLNTILYDHDLKMVAKILDSAQTHQVDGVIVADMSAVQMCQARNLEVHISTQLSISNYAAFKFYAQFSDRIVLARELGLNQIRHIHQQILADELRGPKGNLMEIEAFAHGALCIAISGRCNMSLFSSNASAYRGACEQNCRKAYDVVDQETGKKMVLDNNFVFSPNDIATIAFLDQVIASGVRVLKIEGRGRAPEYVFTVISAYRKALDAIQNDTYTQELTEELLRDIATVYNRGLSSGYYLGKKQGWAKACGNKATRRKVDVGCVTNYFGKIGVAEITATHDLAVGDTFCIVGPTTGVVTGAVEEMRIDDIPVQQVSETDVFSIRTEKKVRRNDRFYLMKEVHAGNSTQTI